MARRTTNYDDYFEISVNNLYTCKNCDKYSKKIDVSKNGTKSLSFHLENHHPLLYKECKQKSKSEADALKSPVHKKRKLVEAGGKQLQINKDLFLLELSKNSLEPVAEIDASLGNIKIVSDDELIVDPIERSDEKTEHSSVEVKTIKMESKMIEPKERENIATEKIADEKNITSNMLANNGDVPTHLLKLLLLDSLVILKK